MTLLAQGVSRIEGRRPRSSNRRGIDCKAGFVRRPNFTKQGIPVNPSRVESVTASASIRNGGTKWLVAVHKSVAQKQDPPRCDYLRNNCEHQWSCDCSIKGPNQCPSLRGVVRKICTPQTLRGSKSHGGRWLRGSCRQRKCVSKRGRSFFNQKKGLAYPPRIT